MYVQDMIDYSMLRSKPCINVKWYEASLMESLLYAGVPPWDLQLPDVGEMLSLRARLKVE